MKLDASHFLIYNYIFEGIGIKSVVLTDLAQWDRIESPEVNSHL